MKFRKKELNEDVNCMELYFEGSDYIKKRVEEFELHIEGQNIGNCEVVDTVPGCGG